MGEEKRELSFLERSFLSDILASIGRRELSPFAAVPTEAVLRGERDTFVGLSNGDVELIRQKARACGVKLPI